ncbi:MAG TPA: hypothetical protein VK457_03840 [Chloroflexota bacterium]|nr:hypothetical protein [Chloroflexota bacterium]
MPTGAAKVAARAVLTTDAHFHDDDGQQYQDKHSDAESLHPSRRTGRRFTVPFMGVVAGGRVWVRVSHVRLLIGVVVTDVVCSYFTTHNVR